MDLRLQFIKANIAVASAERFLYNTRASAAESHK